MLIAQTWFTSARQGTRPPANAGDAAIRHVATTPKGIWSVAGGTSEVARHPYYQEFLAPFGLRWFAGVKVPCGNDYWILSIQRSIEQGPFSSDDVSALRGLSTHLAGPVSLARTLGFAKADAALEAFQISGMAVLVDRFGRVFRVNEAAEAVLDRDIQLRGGHLYSYDHNATVSLRQAVHQFLWLRLNEGPVQPIMLPSRKGRPILVYPTRLTSFSMDVLAPARAAIILVGLNRSIALNDEILRQVFGPSLAEARLSRMLADGNSLEQSSEALGVSYETVRNQLKAVFRKTDTSSQTQLNSLIGRLGRPWREN